MAKQLIIEFLIGISGSGKSTYAHSEWKKDKFNTIVIGRDKLRELLFGYVEENVNNYYSENNLSFYALETKVVTKMFDMILLNSISNFVDDESLSYYHIIIDNTNLKQKYITDIRNLIEEYVWDYVNDGILNLICKETKFDIALDEALIRNEMRVRKVSEEVIKNQFKQLNSK